ncbi:VOC family protein [Cupriavidus sp. UME77]|jgi:catechol 2,3-dioxygenase|uniref:VOC family protein n=1 Tax=Cupriavidus sp. UME77 TaxID=1862321 RepID=UPI0016041B31|nr:VOC family protein [Cupriavidus sp. UME77]MBB1634485.1 hypothetical protein [Cupriavidus sp. UME77]
MAITTQAKFRHLGVYAFQPTELCKFYEHWFGLVVTDHGIGSTGHEVVFMSGDSQEHHQIAFANGRHPDWPGMNQISFLVDSLAELKRLAIAFSEAGVPILQQKDHGNTWSLYVEDPEGNRIEIYTPSPWYVTQPIWWPLDLLSESEDTIRERTYAAALANSSFRTREAWMAQTQVRIDAARKANPI